MKRAMPTMSTPLTDAVARALQRGGVVRTRDLRANPGVRRVLDRTHARVSKARGSW